MYIIMFAVCLYFNRKGLGTRLCNVLTAIDHLLTSPENILHNTSSMSEIAMNTDGAWCMAVLLWQLFGYYCIIGRVAASISLWDFLHDFPLPLSIPLNTKCPFYQQPRLYFLQPNLDSSMGEYLIYSGHQYGRNLLSITIHVHYTLYITQRMF